MPANVNLLTFEPWRENALLVRFEHILAEGEDVQYSKPVTFNFNDVFLNFKVEEIRETTLAANQWLSDAVRLNFTGGSIERSSRRLKPAVHFIKDDDDTLQQDIGIHPIVSARQYRKTPFSRAERQEERDVQPVTLQPMEIRTFVVKLERKP